MNACARVAQRAQKRKKGKTEGKKWELVKMTSSKREQNGAGPISMMSTKGKKYLFGAAKGETEGKSYIFEGTSKANQDTWVGKKKKKRKRKKEFER